GDGQGVVGAELRQLLRLVRRDADDVVPLGLEALASLGEVTGLLGAARGQRSRVEVDDHLATAVVAQAHLTAVVGGQREVGSRVAGSQTGAHGGPLDRRIRRRGATYAVTG